MRWLVVALACALMLAGCASTKSDESSSDATATGTSGTAAKSSSGTAASSSSVSVVKAGNATNRAPAITGFSTNQTVGGATAVVAGQSLKFAFNATDADKDNLTFRLVFGDKTANATGKMPTKGVNHTYAAAGNYTAKVFVSDGKLTVNKTLLVQVTSPAPPAPVAGYAPGMDPACQRPDAIFIPGAGQYIDDRGPFPGTGYLDGGTWMFEESNGIDGLQLTQEPSLFLGEKDPLAVENKCEGGDTLVF